MSARVTIAPGHWLAPPAAASWARMRAAGMPAGGITEAGRTRARQEQLYAQYLAGLLLAYAARPGESLHEKGTAADMVTAHAAHAWLVEHGAAHGWHRPLLHRPKPEPWHWEYDLTRDQHLTDATAPAPITPTTQEDDPMLIVTAPDRPDALVGPGYFRPLSAGVERDVADALAARTLPLNARQWDVARDIALTGQVPSGVPGAVARAVWAYRMDGGPTLQPGAVNIPQETAGERLRQVRRSTQNLRTARIKIADQLARLIGQGATEEETDR